MQRMPDQTISAFRTYRAHWKATWNVLAALQQQSERYAGYLLNSASEQEKDAIQPLMKWLGRCREEQVALAVLHQTIVDKAIDSVTPPIEWEFEFDPVLDFLDEMQ